MKKGNKKIILAILIAVVFTANLLMPLSSAFADDRGVVLRVAFYPLEGFFEYDASGKECGYGVDLLNALRDYLGCSFTYVKANSWEETKTMLLNDEADIRMPGNLPTNPSTTLDYSTESVMDTYHAIITNKSNTDLYYKDFESLKTKKLGITTSIYKLTAVQDYLTEIGLTEDNVVLFDEYLDSKAALDRGEVAALVTNILDLEDDMKIVSRFDSVSNYISMRKGDQRLTAINDALKELKIDNPSFLPSLFAEHYANLTVTPYTREESEYIKNLGTVTVGQLQGAPPLSTIDEKTGEISGIFVDLCELISEKSGLKFAYKIVPEGERAVNWLNNGNGQIVVGVMFSAFSFPSNKLVYSVDAFSTSIVVVRRKGEAFSTESKMTIAMPIGFIGGEQYILSKYPNSTVKTYDTNEKCLKAIVAKEADILLQNLYVVRDSLQSPQFDTLEIMPVYEMEETMRIVALDNDNAMLMSILNKAIDSVTEKEKDDIIARHTLAKPYQMTLADVWYKYKTPITIIIILLAVAAALSLTIILIRNHNVRIMKEKNAELNKAYETARIASKAKGDFLARMSHEIRTPMNAIMGIANLALDHTDEPNVVKDDLQKIGLSSHVLLSIINDVLDMSAIESGKLKTEKAAFDLSEVIESLSAVFYQQCSAKGIDFNTEIIGDVNEKVVGDRLRLSQILMNLLSNAVKFTENGGVCLTVEKLQSEENTPEIRFAVKDSGEGIDESMMERLWLPFE